LKRHLLKRFDLYKEAGLRRVLFTMMKREIGETQEDYYSRLLLEHGNKAFIEENADTIDRMIRDQFMVKNDEKTRKYLIEKGPKTAKEALSLTISSEAANSFDEILKDTAGTIATADVNNKNKSESKAERHEPIERQWNRRSRSSSRDSYDVSKQEIGVSHLMMIDSDLSTAIDIKTEAERDTSLVLVNGMETLTKEAGRGTEPSSRDRYDSDNRDRPTTRPILATVLTTVRGVESATGIGTHLDQQATTKGKSRQEQPKLPFQYSTTRCKRQQQEKLQQKQQWREKKEIS
jgi:hypothetical protein